MPRFCSARACCRPATPAPTIATCNPTLVGRCVRSKAFQHTRGGQQKARRTESFGAAGGEGALGVRIAEALAAAPRRARCCGSVSPTPAARDDGGESRKAGMARARARSALRESARALESVTALRAASIIGARSHRTAPEAGSRSASWRSGSGALSGHQRPRHGFGHVAPHRAASRLPSG